MPVSIYRAELNCGTFCERLDPSAIPLALPTFSTLHFSVQRNSYPPVGQARFLRARHSAPKADAVTDRSDVPFLSPSLSPTAPLPTQSGNRNGFSGSQVFGTSTSPIGVQGQAPCSPKAKSRCRGWKLGLVGFSAGAGAVGSLNAVPVTEFDQFGTFVVEFFHFFFSLYDSGSGFPEPLFWLSLMPAASCRRHPG